jgi:hypothetical protein
MISSLGRSLPRRFANIISEVAVRIASNVPAVYEVPELTDRSAQGFPRPVLIDTSHCLPWQGREAAAA